MTLYVAEENEVTEKTGTDYNSEPESVDLSARDKVSTSGIILERNSTKYSIEFKRILV